MVFLYLVRVSQVVSVNFRLVWTCKGSWWAFQQHDVSLQKPKILRFHFLSCSGLLGLTLVLPQCAVDLLRAMAVVRPIERIPLKIQNPQLRFQTALSHYLLGFSPCRLSKMSFLAENGNKLLDLDAGSILG